MAGPFPPDLHDVRHLWLKAGLLLVWALVSFVAVYFARDLQMMVFGGWPLGYWIVAQGAVVVFIIVVVAYAWAMNRFERQDALQAQQSPSQLPSQSQLQSQDSKRPAGTSPHG